MEQLNLQVAWVAVLLGLLSGTVIGLYFAREDWLGGYASWRRRMIRLGHISFLGTGILNFMFAISVRGIDPPVHVGAASHLLAAGAVAMPLVCFLSAWRKELRHLFFIPVLCLLGGVAAFVVTGLFP